MKNFRNFCDDESLNSKINPIFQNKKCATHPHSFYFEILSEIGLFGLFLLLLLFVTLFYQVLKIYFKTKIIFIIKQLYNSCIFYTFFAKRKFFYKLNAIIFWTAFAILNANYNKLKSK